MERTQKLKLDFTETGSREEFLSAYCGDMNSNVVELEITPALKDGELLICSFLKGDRPIETLVVENNRLTIPYSVLKEAGSYTAAFAVADMASRLTATATLAVTVASDSILIAPTEDMSEDQSLVSYILSASAIAARAAVEEDIEGLTDAVSSMSDTLDSATAAIASVDSDLSLVASDVQLLRGDVDTLLSASPNERLVASGEATLSSSGGSYVCVSPKCLWLRVKNTVFVQLIFYSNGASSFTVNGLPFANSGALAAVPAVHTAYSDSDISLTGDFLIDRLELPSGSSSIKVIRQSSSYGIISGTLIYRTNDPMPEEVTL